MMRAGDLIDTIRDQRSALLRGGVVLLAVVLVGGVAWWWFVIRWKPPPSIFDTPVDDVMGYLALDDFNELSLEERLAFIREFTDRFRGLEQSESAVLAGFLAGLTGPARAQLTQNVRVLAKDILAGGAADYLALESEADRAAFLDDWLVRWMRFGERLATGEESERSDDEYLSSARRDARREVERTPSDVPTLGREGALVFMDFWRSDVEAAASPVEQGQIILFLKDVRSHLVAGE